MSATINVRLPSYSVKSSLVFPVPVYTLFALVLWILPVGEGVALQQEPASVPGPEPGHVVEHRQESAVSHLHHPKK